MCILTYPSQLSARAMSVVTRLYIRHAFRVPLPVILGPAWPGGRTGTYTHTHTHTHARARARALARSLARSLGHSHTYTVSEREKQRQADIKTETHSKTHTHTQMGRQAGRLREREITCWHIHQPTM